MNRLRIVHATSVHARTDTRIALKMCRSLAQSGHDVTLVVADGGADYREENLQIVSVGPVRGRLSRASLVATRVARTALALRADIVHFHDPELLPVFAAMRRPFATQLVFDAHENVPDQIVDKYYLPYWSRRAASRGYAVLERMLVRRVDAIVAATPTIADRYRRFHDHVECIANYAMADEFRGIAEERDPEWAVCYIGGLTPGRGLRQMVDAIAMTRSRVRLKLGGRFDRDSDRSAVARLPGWALVTELGFLDREGVRSTLETSIAGIVTLQPTPAYVDSYPVKLFEYMSAGLPVVASDFPLWRRIVEGAECGLLVDPTEPRSIAQAIDALVEDPELADRMGRNGRRSIETDYNWDAEAKKLHALYDRLLARHDDR